MNSQLEYKSITASGGAAIIKDVDPGQGRVIGYFSVFDNKDADNDVIVKGAYKKTLEENYRRIKYLFQHDPFRPLAGTKLNRLTLEEDSYGLKFDATISQTSWGKDTIQLYVDQVVDEHSVGMNTIRSADKKGYREITEIKLWEGSVVTWGANELAQTTMVKSMTKATLINRMDKVMKSIRNGKYENEEIFDMLELYFKQLQALFNETTKPEQAAAPVVRKRDWAALTQIIN